jgi:SEC-C motif domain protein
MTPSAQTVAPPCPCGAGPYAQCCAPLHAGAVARDAAALMRSRYSAYVLQRADYLLSTWHASTRPHSLSFDGDRTRWLGLDVKRQTLIDATHATVAFVARHRSGGERARRLRETSRFVLESGRWYYVDGDIDPS